MKKLTAFLLIAVMVMSFYGCSCAGNISDSDDVMSGSYDESTTAALPDPDYTAAEMEDVDFAHSSYSAVKLTAGYNSLSDSGEQELYKRIDENVHTISKSSGKNGFQIKPVVLSGVRLTEAQIRHVISAYFSDRPEVYWVDSRFEYSAGSRNTMVMLYSYMSAKEIAAESKLLSDAVKNIFSGITAGMSEFDRELYVHDKLLESCVYVKDVSAVDNSYRTYTSLGALVDGKAVCEGYSRAIQLMLSQLGIETYNVLGIGTDELHMWNCVKLDGSWYYLDSTWNDGDGDGINYNYFNITTEQLAKDHTINKLFTQLTDDEICGSDTSEPVSFNLFVPECTDEAMNFFTLNGVVLTGLDSNNTASICAELKYAAANGEDEIYLRIGGGADYNTTVSELFYSGEYVFFDCVDRVNKELSGVQIDRENINILKKESLSVVTVYLEYV